MYGDRAQMREVFFRAWKKYRDKLPLEGIEKIIVDVAVRHPEYHDVLAQPERYSDADYSPDTGATNPFLHLTMHVAIQEQLAIDQPPGIRARYQQLLQRERDEHAALHILLECLGEMMWQAQRQRQTPDPEIYFACIDRVAQLPPSDS